MAESSLPGLNVRFWLKAVFDFCSEKQQNIEKVRQSAVSFRRYLFTFQPSATTQKGPIWALFQVKQFYFFSQPLEKGTDLFSRSESHRIRFTY